MTDKTGPIRAHDLDVVGACFGFKVENTTVTLYVEDDGLWHPKMCFAQNHTPDLRRSVWNLFRFLKLELG